MAVMYEVVKDAYLTRLLGGGVDLVAREGEIVYAYQGATYGVVDWDNGIACSRGGPLETPFFEIPRSHLRPWADGERARGEG